MLLKHGQFLCSHYEYSNINSNCSQRKEKCVFETNLLIRQQAHRTMKSFSISQYIFASATALISIRIFLFRSVLVPFESTIRLWLKLRTDFFAFCSLFAVELSAHEMRKTITD